jgi:hypothetical protein
MNNSWPGLPLPNVRYKSERGRVISCLDKGKKSRPMFQAQEGLASGKPCAPPFCSNGASKRRDPGL